MTTKKAARKGGGKATNMYLRESDRNRIRTLAKFIAVKGHRVTDSAIISAALRLAKPDDAFFDSFEKGLKLDARKKG
jgi:hypothetical protein